MGLQPCSQKYICKYLRGFHIKLLHVYTPNGRHGVNTHAHTHASRSAPYGCAFTCTRVASTCAPGCHHVDFKRHARDTLQYANADVSGPMDSVTRGAPFPEHKQPNAVFHTRSVPTLLPCSRLPLPYTSFTTLYLDSSLYLGNQIAKLARYLQQHKPPKLCQSSKIRSPAACNGQCILALAPRLLQNCGTVGTKKHRPIPALHYYRLCPHACNKMVLICSGSAKCSL